MTSQPQWHFARSFPDEASIRELLAGCAQIGIAESHLALLRALGGMGSARRLSHNLSNYLLYCAAHRPTENILADGLTRDERECLAALQDPRVPARCREVAHGLLNVHERWIAARALAKAYAQAREQT